MERARTDNRDAVKRGALVVVAALLLGAAEAPRVAVTGGTVEGVTHADRLEFRGIPFAAPPTRDMRWRAPDPVAKWRGVRDTTRPAPACLQNDYGWNRADHIHATEDCLTLDVATPAMTGKRPVIVWIHGGSNRAGSPNGITASSMVQRGVVIVGVRYRLGIFGFLSHRGAALEASGTSGNYGLMDQIAALRWVKANISRFGGDPANVTVAGESAGAQDVGLLLASPQARGLFIKAAMESGTPGFGLPFRSLTEALRLGDQIDAALDSGGNIGSLRKASANALLAADLKLNDAALTANDYMWLRTTIDGTVLPDDPIVLLSAAPPRATIVGSNRFELDLPGGRAWRDAFVDRAFGANAAKARAFYMLDRPDPAADLRLGNLDQQIATDVTFRCPAGRMAEILARAGSPVWRYEFDDGPNGDMTRHAIEIANIFGETRVGGLHLQDYWFNLARSGNPNGASLPAWPRYTGREQTYLMFDARGATQGARLRSEVCDLMERL